MSADWQPDTQTISHAVCLASLDRLVADAIGMHAAVEVEARSPSRCGLSTASTLRGSETSAGAFIVDHQVIALGVIRFPHNGEGWMSAVSSVWT